MRFEPHTVPDAFLVFCSAFLRICARKSPTRAFFLDALQQSVEAADCAGLESGSAVGWYSEKRGHDKLSNTPIRITDNPTVVFTNHDMAVILSKRSLLKYVVKIHVELTIMCLLTATYTTGFVTNVTFRRV